MSNKILLPALILTAGATLLHAQGMVEYGASAGRSAGSAAAAGAGRSASKIFDKLNTSLAGAGKADETVKNGPSSPASPAVVAAVSAAPAPAAPATPALPADFTALVNGMDRADLFKKVGKPSMMMSSMESSRVIETCWYKNGAESITVIVRDGKVAEISGAAK